MSYHTARRPWGELDVWRLIGEIKNAARNGTLSKTSIPVDDIKDALSTIVWEDSIGREFPAGDLALRTSHVSEHYDRIYESTNDPVIVFREALHKKELMEYVPKILQNEWEPAELDLLDGLHRLMKALMTHQKTIDVYDVPLSLVKKALMAPNKSIVSRSRMNRMSKIIK